MARLNNVMREDDNDENTSDATNFRLSKHTQTENGYSPSPSPSVSFSDKENRVTPRTASTRKGKSTSMGPPQRPMSESSRPQKRRKLSQRDSLPNTTQMTHPKRLEEAGDTRYYDPNQSMAERRAVRKEYRDLTRDLTGK